MTAPMPPPMMTAHNKRGYSSATFQRISAWEKTVRKRLARGDALKTENYQIATDASFDAVAAYYAAALQVMGFAPMSDTTLASGGGRGWVKDDQVFALLTVNGEDIDTQRPVYVLTTMALPDR
ncbi:MAG: hypothetical protein AB8G16_03545 [Gammaproteobacteria bacterium]